MPGASVNAVFVLAVVADDQPRPGAPTHPASLPPRCRLPPCCTRFRRCVCVRPQGLHRGTDEGAAVGRRATKPSCAASFRGHHRLGRPGQGPGHVGGVVCSGLRWVDYKVAVGCVFRLS
jgi:hypothetical protein